MQWICDKFLGNLSNIDRMVHWWVPLNVKLRFYNCSIPHLNSSTPVLTNLKVTRVTPFISTMLHDSSFSVRLQAGWIGRDKPKSKFLGIIIRFWRICLKFETVLRQVSWECCWYMMHSLCFWKYFCFRSFYANESHDYIQST